MRLTQVGVHGLFDRFNHDLVFSSDEPIAIMIGPNGFGKTMILRILNGLFSSPLKGLERLPFVDVNLLFDDSSRLAVRRVSTGQSMARSHDRPIVELEYTTSGGNIERTNSEDTQLSEDDLPFPVDEIEESIPVLDQIGPAQWRDRSTGAILDLDDVVADFGDQLPSQPGPYGSQIAWLRELRQSMPVRFIGTERLTLSPSHEPRGPRLRRPYRRALPQRTVRRYSDNLAKMVQRTLTEYATLSQSLDRTFPVRLVAEPANTALSSEQLIQQLTEVEERRSRIVEAGLLGQEHESLSVPVVETVDEAKRSVFAIYVQDAFNKLSVFDDLYARVNTFQRIANSRFLYKHVSVGTDGLKVAALDGSALDLEMLSSGEQHELVLLYDLLFGIAPNSLIMIDEPELSLHVAWQEDLVSDLNEMARLSEFRVLLATHSPQIIGDRWDLAIELRGPEEG